MNKINKTKNKGKPLKKHYPAIVPFKGTMWY